MGVVLSKTAHEALIKDNCRRVDTTTTAHLDKPENRSGDGQAYTTIKEAHCALSKI